MIKFKRFLLGALALTCSSFVMAQTSNTNISTAGIFGNDTDDFMDVNSWSNVAPENFFGKLYYNDNNKRLNLGAAKNIGGFYFGANLSGNIGFNFNSVSDKTETSSSSTTTSSKTSTFSGRNSEFDLSALIGIGDNLGIKASFYYDGDPDSISTSTETAGSSSEEYVKKQVFRPQVRVGYNAKVNNLSLKNFGNFYININQDATKNATTDTNNTKTDYVLGGGTTIAFPKKNNISQELGGTLWWSIQYRKPTDVSTAASDDVTKYFNTGIRFYPSYKITYDKIERLSLGAKISCPIESEFDSSTQTEKIIDSSIVTKKYTNILEFSLSLALGLQYQVIPEKLTINAGASIFSPSLTAKFEGENQNNSGTETSVSTSTTKWIGSSSAASLNLRSGFTYVLAKTVTFDCSYNILSDLLYGNLDTKWQPGNTTSVWNNVNMILFHTLNLQLSVKL